MRNICEISDKTFGDLPEKVLQIGEGNFLRAFAEWIIETGNRQGVLSTSVLVCQPIEKGNCDLINAQSGIYTVYMRGISKNAVFEDMQKITCISRCINPYREYEDLLEAARSEDLEVIISNTTEAGIAYKEGDRLTDTPPSSYPAKLTALLYERFSVFPSKDKGVLILPVELIDDNGAKLKSIVLRYAKEWELGDEFISWLEEGCYFANTLVDRIVTGFPADEYAEICAKMGYEDKLLVTCEPYLFWAIQCPKEWAEKFPIDKLGFNIIFADDISPYRERKVRILNGAHTLSVLAAFLTGHEFVIDMMRDGFFSEFIRKAIFSEIIPTLSLPEKELVSFAESVLDRFSNHFIKHRLHDISLNSVSKFKARCLPSLLKYKEIKGALPDKLCFSLAALIRFYKCRFEDGKYLGKDDSGREYEIRDGEDVKEFMRSAWESGDAAKAVLSNISFWDMDLTEIQGLEEKVRGYLIDIESLGIRKALEKNF
jgi:tagaturonate reductase